MTSFSIYGIVGTICGVNSNNFTNAYYAGGNGLLPQLYMGYCIIGRNFFKIVTGNGIGRLRVTLGLYVNNYTIVIEILPDPFTYIIKSFYGVTTTIGLNVSRTRVTLILFKGLVRGNGGSTYAHATRGGYVCLL